MAFRKGQGRLGGRKKGTPNKSTTLIKSFLDEIINSDEMQEKLRREIKSLKGEKFVRAFTDLLEYVQPKLARTEVVGDKDQPVQHIVTLELDADADIDDTTDEA